MMKLISIESASFGTLNIMSPLEFTPGLNVCIAPNQAGKSTLLTLIEWLLFGVPAKKTKKDQQLVERWRPWRGGDPQAAIVLAPEHPGWPERVRMSVEFEDFTPHLQDAGTLAELAGEEYLRIDGNGTWDIGERLTGLGRVAFGLSLMARQEEMESVLTDSGLRRLLTADLAGLVEDPERATLDEALRALVDPRFIMPGLAVGEVQLNYLIRNAKAQWQMAEGELATEEERFEALAELIARRGAAELALRELQEHVESLAGEGSRLELAVAHWRFTQQARLEEQIAQWQERLKQEPWLKEFPAEKGREIEGWLADRRHLEVQRTRAEALEREAESLKLRAPYVEQVKPELAPELAVWTERVGKAREEIKQGTAKLQRSEGMLRDIDSRLKRSEKIAEQVPGLDELNELHSAMTAAQADWDTADANVTEYGVGTETVQRERLDELEEIIAPHNDYRVQVSEHISQGTQLGEEHRELAAQRELLEAKAKAGGQALAVTGAVLVFAGILAAVFGGAVLSPAWLAYALGAVLLIAGGWLALGGMKRNRQTAAAHIELTKAVEPKFTELAERAEALSIKAAALREQHGITIKVWDQLITAFPEYRQLTFELQKYHEALHQRTLAGQRLVNNWSRLGTLCADAQAEHDAEWLAQRISELKQLREYQQQRQDEHAKLRDTETTLARLRGEEEKALSQLKSELEPLALDELLTKDAGRALREFNRMCDDTKRYRELRDKARETGQLETQERDLSEKLGRKLAPLGLGEMAAADPDAALREFEKRRDDAKQHAQLQDSLDDAVEQIRHLALTREEYAGGWQALLQETRDELTAMAVDEAACDDLLTKRRNLADNYERTQRELERKREEVNDLRVQAAKDEDVESTLAEARQKHVTAQAQHVTVDTWHRALILLGQTLRRLAGELASNLAPRLRDELAAVLAQAPVAHVQHAGFSDSLELLLKVDGAPPGLAGEELLARLSVGARRQLALAVRLAVAKALGDEGHPLMLLDEPLAELDDGHARACLEYVGRLAAEHQVLLTTCHAQQYAWLSQQAGVDANVISLPD